MSETMEPPAENGEPAEEGAEEVLYDSEKDGPVLPPGPPIEPRTDEAEPGDEPLMPPPDPNAEPASDDDEAMDDEGEGAA